MSEPEIDFGELPAGLADFPRKWRDDAVPALRAMEHRRVFAVRLFFGATALAVIAGLIVLAMLGADGLAGFEWFVGMAVILVPAGLAYIPLANLRPKVKSVVVTCAVEAAGLSWRHKGFEPDHFQDIRNLKLVPHFDRSGFEDRLHGERTGVAFTLYEAHLEVRQRDSKGRTTYYTVFRGILGHVDFPSTALGTTVLARDGGWFDKLGAPAGLKRAGLEDPVFEKAFTAWTSDQVEARYFLNPKVMQDLLDLETRFRGKKLRCAFRPGHMLFAIETGDWFEAGSLFRKLDDPSRPKKLVQEMAAVFDLLDTLAECAPRKDMRRRAEA